MKAVEIAPDIATNDNKVVVGIAAANPMKPAVTIATTPAINVSRFNSDWKSTEIS